MHWGVGEGYTRRVGGCTGVLGGVQQGIAVCGGD